MEDDMYYIGIDPGASGAIAAIERKKVDLWPFKKYTLADQWDILESYSYTTFGEVAYLETVHSMPGQGVVSTFKFGQSYGQLEALLTAACIPFERVTPAKWQKEFGLLKKKGETNTQKKNRHKALAQELFPDVTITHAVADALLIAEYGRRQR